MDNKNKHEFFKTGKVKDYLNYKGKNKLEVAEELTVQNGEKNGTKGRNNSKDK